MDSAEPPGFLARLKRRKIGQWTLAYLSGAWLLLQVVNVIGAQFAWPAALGRGITVALGAGLVATLIVAWYHGEKGHQRVTRTELVLIAVVLAGSGFLMRAVAGDSGQDDGADARRPAALAADLLAVVPFGTATPDAELERLGRDLAVTLGATLDGIETLHVVDPLALLAQTARNAGPLSLPQARALAQRHGAGRVLHGSLARDGERVRLDATLYATAGGRALARVTLLDDPDHVSAITDSVVFSLARQLWTNGSPNIPGPASLATTSVAALRSYLAGEQALANGEMGRAIAAFEQAYAADSTYWFAYWRSLYPRSYEGSRADSAVVARVLAHRDALPAADRALIEARLAPTLQAQVALLEQAVRRHPAYWPALYTYANLLVHWTPYVGTSYDAPRAALERFLTLHPGFLPAWEHLLWVTAHQRDSAATAAIVERLADFSSSDGGRMDADRLTLYRTSAHILTNGGDFTEDELQATADYILGYRGSIPLEAFGTGLLVNGFPRATVQLADRVLARGADGALAAGMLHGRALGLAGRGAWDSAAVAADRWAAQTGSPANAVAAYGLAAAGAALGMLPADAAAARRPAGPPVDAPRWLHVELAWLDGVAAFARADHAALAAAQRRLAASASPFEPLLAGSLEAFASALAGRTGEAARRISAVELDAADHFLAGRYSRIHPYVSSVNRLLAAQWLLDEGDAASAHRLLTFMEAVLPGAPPLEAVNRTVGALGFYHRARAAEAMGREPEASTQYLWFIEQFDQPVPALVPLIEDARARLAAIARRRG